VHLKTAAVAFELAGRADVSKRVTDGVRPRRSQLRGDDQVGEGFTRRRRGTRQRCRAVKTHSRNRQRVQRSNGVMTESVIALPGSRTTQAQRRVDDRHLEGCSDSRLTDGSPLNAPGDHNVRESVAADNGRRRRGRSSGDSGRSLRYVIPNEDRRSPTSVANHRIPCSEVKGQSQG